MLCRGNLGIDIFSKTFFSKYFSDGCKDSKRNEDHLKESNVKNWFVLEIYSLVPDNSAYKILGYVWKNVPH